MRPFLLSLCFFIMLGSQLSAQEESFEAFTGKVVRNKVRMRLSDDLESPIIRELPKGELLMVIGETEDFYAVKPPADIKTYVFRTFVLEDTVEGTRVNVRLQPNLESPVITQLNSGDRVEGKISTENSKWLEISPPETVAFYIYKDYLDNVGDVNYLATMEKRLKEVNHLLNTTYQMSQDEIQKPFNDIDLNPIMANIDEIIQSYADFPEHSKRAKELQTLIQDHYLEQKAAYLEFKTQETSEEWQNKNAELLAEMEMQKDRLKDLEKQLEEERNRPIAYDNVEDTPPTKIVVKKETPPKTLPLLQENTSHWTEVEQNLFEQWISENDQQSIDEFYLQQKTQAKVVSGILKPYDRIVKNKPGDYLLVNPATQTPIAFLYSTQVDLTKKVGQQVSVRVSPRPDHHFAFPAYYVHLVE